MNALTIAILTSLSLAEPRSIYRFPVTSQGAIEPAEIDALHERIDGLVSGADFEFLAPVDPTVCEDSQCWLDLAIKANAAYSVAVDVDASSADQQLTLTITDLADGTAVVELERTCELCGRDELLDAVSDLTATGMRKLQSYAAVSTTLSITSEPPGAIARIDGAEVGTTPIELEVTPGAHEIELTAEGHEPMAQSIELERGANERMRLHMSPIVAELPPETTGPTRRRGRVIAGAALLGAGFAGLGAGITMLVIHGRPITRDCGGNDVDLDGDCHYLHDTRVGGAVGAAAGGAALIAGGVLLGIELRRKKPSSVAVHPTPSGVVFSGRF